MDSIHAFAAIDCDRHVIPKSVSSSVARKRFTLVVLNQQDPPSNQLWRRCRRWTGCKHGLSRRGIRTQSGADRVEEVLPAHSLLKKPSKINIRMTGQSSSRSNAETIQNFRYPVKTWGFPP